MQITEEILVRMEKEANRPGIADYWLKDNIKVLVDEVRRLKLKIAWLEEVTFKNERDALVKALAMKVVSRPCISFIDSRGNRHYLCPHQLSDGICNEGYPGLIRCWYIYGEQMAVREEKEAANAAD